MVSNDYADVVIFLHEHYKNIEQENTRFFAIKDHPAKTSNFEQNDNTNYWINELKNHIGFQEECDKRGIAKDEFFYKGQARDCQKFNYI